MDIRILIVDMAYPINTRCQRMEASLKKAYGDSNIAVVGWNRENENLLELPNHYVFNKRAIPGDKLKKLVNLRKYSKFIGNVIEEFNPTIIIASLWQSLVLCSKYIKKGIYLIYDNIDVPAGSLIVVKISRFLESRALYKTQAIIHASRFFRELYSDFRGHQMIIENTPTQIEDINQTSIKPGSDSTLRIVFNGALRYPTTMINLIKAVGNIPGIIVDFHGKGVGNQGETITKASSIYHNIHFHGAYKYQETPNILKKADLIWAVYPSTSSNVKYAISNKFHEALAYIKPAVFAKGTRLGEFVIENNIGYAVDGLDIEDIRNTLLYIKQNKDKELFKIQKNIEVFRNTQTLLWEESIQPLLKYIDKLNNTN